MKIYLCLINISFLLLISLNAYGQDSKKGLWEFSVGCGPSLPIGSYLNKNSSKSAIIDKNVSFTRIVGFAKNKSGFAKIGLNYNFEIKFKISSRFLLLISSGRFINPIESNSMTNYLSQATNLRQEVVESDYKFIYIMPGIGYRYTLNDIDFNLNLNAGYSSTDFPFYKFILLYTSTNTNPPLVFEHDGSTPSLGAFAIGCALAVNYNITKHFKVGAETFYYRSNFKYHMSNHVIPGGSEVFEINDILKTSAVNADIRLGYCF